MLPATELSKLVSPVPVKSELLFAWTSRSNRALIQPLMESVAPGPLTVVLLFFDTVDFCLLLPVRLSEISTVSRSPTRKGDGSSKSETLEFALKREPVFSSGTCGRGLLILVGRTTVGAGELMQPARPKASMAPAQIRWFMMFR